MNKAALLIVRQTIRLLLTGSLFWSCHRQPVKEMSETANPLTGSWEKVSSIKCSEIYPNVIEFSPNGIYQTQSEVTTIQIIWDAGTYEVDRQIVKITNTQEISKTYRFVIKNEMVTFEDDQGCKFPYRRM